MGPDGNRTTAATANWNGSVVTVPGASGATPSQEEAERDKVAVTSNPATVRAQRKPARGGAIIDWLLVRSELAQARAAATQLTSEQQEFVRRAKLALELGELAFRPGNAVRSGSTAAHASNLFRQAVYWALLARRRTTGPISPEQLWAELGRSLPPSLAGDEAEEAFLARAMRSTFVEFAQDSEEAQRASAVRLHRVAKRMVSDVQRVNWRLEWAKLKRLVLVGLALAILSSAVIWLWPPKVDLAKGKPWRVSSIGAECHPEKSECGGAKTNILFHTRQEQDPWFEYDFGAPISFSSLTIRNRSDYGPERAVPLVVEVSNDDKSFTQIARREAQFSTWEPSFKTRARYLRLRVARESMLHLEAVAVHP